MPCHLLYERRLFAAETLMTIQFRIPHSEFRIKSSSAFLIILTRRCTDFFDKAELSKGGFGCSVTLPLNIYFQLDRAVVGAEHLSMYIGGHKLAVERL